MEKNWVIVHTASSEHEAYIVRGLLETHGITSQIKSMAVPQFPFTVDGMAERAIYVPEDQHEEGVRLLEEFLKNQSED